jgi:hypothetical protein
VQRLAYGLFLLVAVHGLLYQILERRRPLFVAALVVSFGAIACLQGHAIRRRSDGAAAEDTK